MRGHFFIVGDQVAYLPPHADSIAHQDVELGFVTGFASGGVRVRYWSKYNRSLRTVSCSETTPIDSLIPVMSRPQVEVWAIVECVMGREAKEKMMAERLEMGGLL